ncbi:MAG TPA: hypothetical protein VLA37_10110 [Sphingomonadaceae bacterium]|nr:hypothetical protein [Sphingomonadaceae bacterium]
MHETTMEDRKAELASLLEKIKAAPEGQWTAERERIAVLQRQLAAHEKAGNDA